MVRHKSDPSRRVLDGQPQKHTTEHEEERREKLQVAVPGTRTNNVHDHNERHEKNKENQLQLAIPKRQDDKNARHEQRPDKRKMAAPQKRAVEQAQKHRDKLQVAVPEQRAVAVDDEEERRFKDWEKRAKPQAAYVKYMKKVNETGWKRSNARFWFNVNKIHEKYARRDTSREVVYDWSLNKVLVPEGVDDDEVEAQADQMERLPEFGDAILSCLDPVGDPDEKDSPRANQRELLNKIFERQYKDQPLALIPKAPLPIILPAPEAPEETVRRKRTFEFEGTEATIQQLLNSGSDLFALFGQKKPDAITDTEWQQISDSLSPKGREETPMVEAIVEQPPDETTSTSMSDMCIKEEPTTDEVSNFMEAVIKEEPRDDCEPADCSGATADHGPVIEVMKEEPMEKEHNEVTTLRTSLATPKAKKVDRSPPSNNSSVRRSARIASKMAQSTSPVDIATESQQQPSRKRASLPPTTPILKRPKNNEKSLSERGVKQARAAKRPNRKSEPARQLDMDWTPIARTTRISKDRKSKSEPARTKKISQGFSAPVSQTAMVGTPNVTTKSRRSSTSRKEKEEPIGSVKKSRVQTCPSTKLKLPLLSSLNSSAMLLSPLHPSSSSIGNNSPNTHVKLANWVTAQQKATAERNFETDRYAENLERRYSQIVRQARRRQEILNKRSI